MNRQIIGLRLAMILRCFDVPSLEREEGRTSLVEAASKLRVIAIVVTVAVIALQGQISGIFNTVGSSL